MGDFSRQFDPFAVSTRHDFASNNTRLILTRWAAGVLVLLATLLGVHWWDLPLPERSLYGVGAVILAYNGLLAWLTRHIATSLSDELYLKRIRQLIMLQVMLDWLGMAVFLHLTGGITSPATSFFFIHVLMVTILLPGQSPYIYVTLAIGVMIVLAALESAGTLNHYTVIEGLPDDLHQNFDYVLAQIIFFGVSLFSIAFLTSSIMGRLRERDRQVTALFQATQDVSSTLEISEVVDRLARNTVAALSVPAASIRLLDDSGENLTMVVAYGLSENYLDKGPLAVSQNELAREVLAGHSVIVPDTLIEARFQYPQKVVEEGIRSMLVVPIMGRTRALGLMRVYSYLPNYFTAEDATFVMTIARQCATAIENALAHEALHKADEERAQFVRIVTHELRAPVTGSQSLLRVLSRNIAGQLTPQQLDIVNRLDTRMDRLLNLISDLLDFAATKSAPRHDKEESLDLLPVLQAVVDRLMPAAQEKHLSLTYEAPHDQALPVCATEAGLDRIFDNLIGNAIKYTPENGSIEVRVEHQFSSVLVIVEDTGIGIPEEEISKLGEEFFRAPNARESGIMGTGLGLAIVKQLIDNFGGLMRVQSQVNVGTTFTVTLPLVELE